MRRFMLVLGLSLFSTLAQATSINGVLVMAGLDTFTGNTVTFNNPSTVLEATGTLAVMKGTTNLNLNNIANFSTELGQTFFSWTSGGTTVTLDITGFTVTRDSVNFLNVLGTGIVTETGFDNTAYDWSLTSTKPDGVTSYTMDLVAPEIPEPAPLVLVGTGLLLFAGLMHSRKRRLNASQCA